jgi:hypothetical protein
MHRLEVGKPYDPTRRSWFEGADYSSLGGHEPRIFLRNASKAEVAAAEKGKIGFGLLV